jgi:hypothetical protein
VDVIPHVIWRDRNTDFAIVTTNLTGINEVSVGGVRYDAKQIATTTTARGTVLYVSVPNFLSSITNATNTVEFFVSGAVGSVSKPIPLSLQGRISGDAVATINRDGSGKVIGLDLRHGAELKESELLNVVKEILEKSESPAKTTNIVP